MRTWFREIIRSRPRVWSQWSSFSAFRLFELVQLRYFWAELCQSDVTSRHNGLLMTSHSDITQTGVVFERLSALHLYGFQRERERERGTDRKKLFKPPLHNLSSTHSDGDLQMNQKLWKNIEVFSPVIWIFSKTYGCWLDLVQYFVEIVLWFIFGLCLGCGNGIVMNSHRCGHMAFWYYLAICHNVW